MFQNLNSLRVKVTEQKRKDNFLKSMFGHRHAVHLRSYFDTWRFKCHQRGTAQNVDEEGPVVEETLDQRVKLANYIHFLKDQGYTDLEINQIKKWADDRQRELLQRSVARLRHYTVEDDLYLKPKMFDRWRLYVKLRKHIRQVLNNICAKLHPKHADLSVAFNRWKYSKRHLLSGIDRKQLAAKCANDERHKEQLFNLED